MKGSIADAKSILGNDGAWDYSYPVKIVCENEHDLEQRWVNARNSKI